MHSDSLKYYRLIGQLNLSISKSETFFDAIKGGLKIILDNTSADGAVLWLYNNKTGKLCPYFWISPIDFTNKYYMDKSSIQYRVYLENRTILVNDDCKLSSVQGYDISSLLCVPLGNGSTIHGVVELFKTKEHSIFSEEEKDICEILTMMADLAIADKHDFTIDLEQGTTLLSARDIHKTYLNGNIKTNVLKGVNIDVVEGEIMVILGESGCGKSTFLNIISGLDKPSSGTFSFMGKDLTNASEEELTLFRRNNIGFVFQSYNLMPNLNALQNLDLIGELVDNPMPSKDALKLVGLEDKMYNYPSELSGGQQQRVSIARALVKKPKLIFADEPTAALDYETSIEVLSVLEEVAKTGTTILMVTHNEEITKMANRVLRMRNGKTYEVNINYFPLKAKDLVW